MPQYGQRAADMVEVKMREHKQVDMVDALAHEVIDHRGSLGTLGKLNVRPARIHEHDEIRRVVAN
jgi:hypothetical protein